MTSIQKVLISYDEYLRLKDIESRFQAVNLELAELKAKLGKQLQYLYISFPFFVTQIFKFIFNTKIY